MPIQIDCPECGGKGTIIKKVYGPYPDAEIMCTNPNCKDGKITVYTEAEMQKVVEDVFKLFKPTAEMKAELIGEFFMNVNYWDDEKECEAIQEVIIPWTLTKDIIKAVVKHAGAMRARK